MVTTYEICDPSVFTVLLVVCLVKLLTALFGDTFKVSKETFKVSIDGFLLGLAGKGFFGIGLL